MKFKRKRSPLLENLNGNESFAFKIVGTENNILLYYTFN